MRTLRLDWPDCHNVRDVGGLPLSSGVRTRHGALIRADSLDRLRPAGVRAIRACGVRRIVDLRSPHELAGRTHPFGDDPAYRLVPFVDERRDGERDRSSERTRADLYRGSIDRNGAQVAAAVEAIVSAPPGPVVVHCLAGTDRTGMLVALVLDALGVRRPAIVDDYALSERSRPPHPQTSTGTRFRPADATTMSDVLAHVDRRHGGVHAYLRTHGVGADRLALLHDRLV